MRCCHHSACWAIRRPPHRGQRQRRKATPQGNAARQRRKATPQGNAARQRRKAALLARESDDSVEPTAGAGGAGEALREVSTADQLAQLSEDEARQRLACGFTALCDRLQVGREERRQELPPRLVEQRVSGGAGLAERHTQVRRTGRATISV
jgi:hypothetical protein